MQGHYYTEGTSRFVKMFDRAFDCLNVSRANQRHKGKEERRPYDSVDDFRFEVSSIQSRCKMRNPFSGVNS